MTVRWVGLTQNLAYSAIQFGLFVTVATTTLEYVLTASLGVTFLCVGGVWWRYAEGAA